MKQKKTQTAATSKQEQNTGVSYNIKGFQVLRSLIVEPGIDMLNNFDANKLKIIINLDFSFNIEQNSFQVILPIAYTYNYNGTDVSLIELVFASDFVISDIKQVMDVNDNSFNIQHEFLYTLVNLAYTSARGVLYEKTRGSALNQFLLPLIDVNSIISQKMNADNAKFNG